MLLIKKIIRRSLTNGARYPDHHPVLERIFQSRHLASAESLDHRIQKLLPFHTLKNIDAAAARLVAAIRQQEKILIIGDFDCDGATSTALAMRVLHQFGAQNIDYLVPNRFTYGYGLTPEIVDFAAENKKPQLIITVDNGIASVAGVERAKQNGIEVIITDHHLSGKMLPDAVAIVNPNQPGDEFPSKNMAGVGVIFYTLLATRALLQKINWFTENNIPVPNMADFLDLVALGTIADVVPLDHNNRIMVQQGLERIRQDRCAPGIRALLEAAKRDQKRMTTSDLAFTVGPRLNAAGRLQDMTLGIQCLLSDQLFHARILAAELNELNVQRQGIESTMQDEALKIVEKLQFSEALPCALTLFDEGWHQGVMGLVASRMKEKTHRPVIAFSAVDDIFLKGSGRSVPGVHIRDVLDAIATRHPELLHKFGGHAMAAGLTLEKKYLSQFNALFCEEVSKYLKADEIAAVIETDGMLAADDCTVELAESLRNFPWGQNFPEPVFDGFFAVVEKYLLNEKHLKLKIRFENEDEIFDAIYFNISEEALLWFEEKRVHLVYRLDVNRYQGESRLQFIVVEIFAGDVLQSGRYRSGSDCEGR